MAARSAPGFDLDELLADYIGTHAPPWTSPSLSAKVCDRLYSMNTPSVAVLEGYVTAGGFELMISCDFAIAADDAKIGDFHIRRALFGGAGPIYRVPAHDRHPQDQGADAHRQAAVGRARRPTST